MCCSMRPPTPRLRINSEDFIEHEDGPPCLENSINSNSSRTQNNATSNTLILEAASNCTTDVSVL